MLSRKFYDVLTILFVLGVVGFLMYNQLTFESGVVSRDEFDSAVKGIIMDMLIVEIIGGIYWIFVFILAIQMYKKELIGMFDLVIVIIIPPLAVVYYLASLRKRFNQVGV